MITDPEDIPRLFAKAWNERDAHALAALFAEDADFVNVVGLWWQNRADIEQAHHYGLTTFFRHSTISPRRVKLRWLGENVCIVHTRWRLSGQIGPEGREIEDRFAIMMFVAERDTGVWRVQAAQNTDIVPGAESFALKDGTMVATDYRGATFAVDKKKP